jgi:hypothetical protein
MQCSQLAKALEVVDLYRSAEEATGGFFVYLS